MRIPVISTVTAAMTLAAAMTLSAQTPAQTRPQTQPQTDRQRPSTDTQTRGNNSMQSVTVQGCVSEGTNASAGTSSSAGRTGSNDNNYILTNVKMSQGSTTSGLALANSYRLQGLSASDLKNHVGHQVEIVGTLQNDGHMTGATGAGMSGAGTTGSGTAGAGTTGTTGAGATTGTTGQRGNTGTTGQRGAAGSTAQRGSGSMGQSGNRNNGDLQELRASSVKMISQTCSAQ